MTITEINEVLSFQRAASSYKTNPRSFATLSYRIRGDAVFICDKEQIHVGDGDCILIPAGVSYRHKSDCTEEIIAIHFHTSENIKNKGILRIIPHNPALCDSLFRQMPICSHDPDPSARYQLFSLLYAILGELSRNASKEDIPLFIRKAEATARERFSDPTLSVEDLISMSGVSPAAFRRAFLSAYGISPRKYIIRMRLSHADTLLRHGRISVQEAARQSGFVDEKYFSRVYYKAHGISPGKAKGNQL